MEEVEKTLEAYDNDTVLEANPFLYTRLKAAMEGKEPARKRSLPFSVVINPALIILLLLINVLTIFYVYTKEADASLRARLVTEMKSEFQIEQTETNF